MLEIPTITLYNPHAMLVALNEKGNETRGWYTKYRGPLAIHAGAYRGWKDLISQEPFKSVLAKHGYVNWKDLPFGAVVAICNLVDCQKIVFRDYTFAKLENGTYVKDNERAFGDYAPGRYAWILKDIHPLKTPIQVKGRQGIWNFDYEPYQIAIDPWKIGAAKIWTPKGIRSGKQVAQGSKDSVLGLEVI